MMHQMWEIRHREDWAFLSCALLFEFGIDLAEMARTDHGDEADWLVRLFLSETDLLNAGEIRRAASLLGVRPHRVPFIVSQMQSVLAPHWELIDSPMFCEDYYNEHCQSRAG